MPETMTVAEAGRRGAAARVRNQTPEQRRESARHAARSRWDRVTESRREQGLSPTLDDARFLDELAREVQGGGPDGA